MIKLDITEEELVFECEGKTIDVASELAWGIDTAIKRIAISCEEDEEVLRATILATILTVNEGNK